MSPTAGGGGVPLRVALAGAALLVIGTVGGGWLYLRSLGADIYADAPIAVDEVAPDRAALVAVVARVAAAQAAGDGVGLTEVEWNRLVAAEVLDDPARAIRFDLAPPFLRLRLSQRDPDSGRYLNATLLVQLFPDADGLGLAVRSGEVGRVSLASTRGEWARTRIERQLGAELLDNPRLGPLFKGLRGARVEADQVRLDYARQPG